MNNPTAARSDEIARSDALRLRWAFITLIVLGGIVNYLDRSTLSIGNTTIAKELGFNALQMGLLLSAFSWPYAIANLPAGYLIDRFGVKKMFLAAAIGWSLVAIGTSVLQSFMAIYIARALLGVAESPFFAAGLKASQLWFAKRERTMPVSIVNTGSQIANAIAPPLLTFLLLSTGWRTMFVIVGLLGFVVAGIWWFTYRDPNREEEVAIKGAADLEAELKADAPAGQAKANWFSLLKRPNTWFMMLGAFGIFYTVWVYLTWLPSYLQKSRGFSLSATGWFARRIALPSAASSAYCLVDGCRLG